jgi:hypothetical protein
VEGVRQPSAPDDSSSQRNGARRLSAILCADWGKDFPKRAIYVADVAARAVRRVSANGWSVAGVLEEAERWSSTGSVLATFDAPLGVPESYLAALSRVSSGQPSATFFDLLARARTMSRFFDSTSLARDWSLERPIFSVPAGEGGLRSYVDVAARHGVNEDDFDACITAAALLRCVLDGSALCPHRLESAASEGGMLGTGSMNLHLPKQTFAGPGRVRLTVLPAAQTLGRSIEPASREADERDRASFYQCPIAGCDKVFQGSRGGWDGHVGSLRLHLGWHPELREAAERRRQFETEFPDFFR